MKTPAYSSFARHWQLDSTVTYLNHGAFGACPVPVLKKQDEYRKQMEQEPVKFIARDLEEMIWKSKETLAYFVQAKPEDLVFIPNATHGVNIVLNSLKFEEGDELLTTNHEYAASAEAMKWFAKRSGARMVIADVPFPISSSEEVTQAILSKVTVKTKLVMIDHITSATGIIFPVEEIVKRLKEKDIDCLVDGAHAAGQIDLDIEKIDAAYYTGNCHKWICSPKGSAFLHVRKDRQDKIHPLVVTHFYDRPGTEERVWSSRFFLPGTNDYSAYLCVKDAIEWMNTLFEGGWTEQRNNNRSLCIQARKMLAEKIGTVLPAPEEMIANLSTIYLEKAEPAPFGFNYFHPLQDHLWKEYKIEVPVIVWNRDDTRLWFRIAVQCYNSLEQFEYLGEALQNVLSAKGN